MSFLDKFNKLKQFAKESTFYPRFCFPVPIARTLVSSRLPHSFLLIPIPHHDVCICCN